MDSGNPGRLLRLVAMQNRSFSKAGRRLVRPLLLALALLAGIMLANPAGFGGDESLAAAPGEELPVTATPLPLNRNDPGQDRIGSLRFMGAVHLRSSHAGFGGISGLRAGPDGRFLAITDTGNWLAFRTLEQQGRLVGIREVHMRPLRMADGKPAPDKQTGDAEALEWDPASGDASVVFEQDHRIVHWKGVDPQRLDTLDNPAWRTERMPLMADWPANGGGEAMVRWRAPDGAAARLVIAEDVVQDNGDRLALFTHGGQTRTVGIAGVEEHKPTDAVMVDANRMLVLHRRFNLKGAGAAISLLDLAPLFADPPGRRLPARLLAQWQAPVLLDNMEGLAVVREGERLFVYVVSDDNLLSLQKTLLMKFALDLP